MGGMLMILKQQWLARRFGYRYYMTGALLLFIAGTLAAATSHNLAQLVAARFVQGVGGGSLFTSCRILIVAMFGAADRPRATRIFMIGIFGASALAPALAAELIDRGVWQDVFYGVLPFAVLAAIGAAAAGRRAACAGRRPGAGAAVAVRYRGGGAAGRHDRGALRYLLAPAAPAAGVPARAGAAGLLPVAAMAPCGTGAAPAPVAQPGLPDRPGAVLPLLRGQQPERLSLPRLCGAGPEDPAGHHGLAQQLRRAGELWRHLVYLRVAPRLPDKKPLIVCGLLL